MKKTVFFLGAGSTKAACQAAPVNENLVKNALDRNSSSFQAKQVKKFIKDIYGRSSKQLSNNQIWNFLDYIIQQGKSASPEYNFENILKIRTALINLIIKEIEESLRNAAHTIFDNFVSKIQKPDEKVTIISTNYDILIDNALYNANCNYGVKIRALIGEIRQDMEGGLKRAYASGNYIINRGKILLLKIHGSLNWLYCSECDEVDITGLEKGALKIIESDCYCYNKMCTNKYEPLLITPTMYKNYENRIIKDTWNYAEKELIEADDLVFIGYALKEEDYEIRCLLMKAMLNKKKRYSKVIVVEADPEACKNNKSTADIQEKYKHLYGSIEFLPIGFEKYIERI